MCLRSFCSFWSVVFLWLSWHITPSSSNSRLLSLGLPEVSQWLVGGRLWHHSLLSDQWSPFHFLSVLPKWPVGQLCLWLCPFRSLPALCFSLSSPFLLAPPPYISPSTLLRVRRHLLIISPLYRWSLRGLYNGLISHSCSQVRVSGPVTPGLVSLITGPEGAWGHLTGPLEKSRLCLLQRWLVLGRKCIFLGVASSMVNWSPEPLTSLLFSCP